ncbi:MAG: hypothetical protein GY810_08045 [Aureispira sp.]|nr:hypothetical protein [Aureispira sp.]
MMNIINTSAQNSSKVIVDGKAKTPGYSSYEYEGKRLKYASLIPYYRHTYYGRKNAGFSCAPKAIIRKGCWIEYWSNGKYKDHGYWLGQKIENMPKPDFGKLQSILTKGGFDPLDQLKPSTLFDLLDIHGYALDESGKISWSSEHKVRVSGTVTLTKFYGSKETQKCTVPASFTFERSSCGKSFTFKEAYFSLGGNGSATKVLETKTHSSDEMKKLKLQSIGRKRAEAKAKEKWESLAKIDIPKFKHFHELVFFARNLFMNGSKEEVESFLYKTTPSYRFQEGSEYLITYRAEEAISSAMNHIFKEGQSYRTQYCEVMQHKGHTKNWYSYYNADQSYHTKLIGEQEKGIWKLKDAEIYLSDNFENAECPAPVELELLTDKTYGFSIQMPKGYTKKDLGSAVLYEAKANGVTYVVIANNFGSEESNSARYEQAKSNWKQHSMSGIASYDEIKTDWKINNATGTDVRFFGSFRGRGGSTKFEEWYRSAYLGDINFEIYVRDLDHSPENIEFMKSFKTSLAGNAGSTEASAPKTKDKYTVGDHVLVNTGKWEAAIVEKVNSNGTYDVATVKTKKSYTAPNDALRVDPNPSTTTTTTAKEEVTKSTNGYAVGDKVLVRISQTAWTPGVIKEKKSDGRYLVHCTKINKHYIQPTANLKMAN